jgi:hypothetical protein
MELDPESLTEKSVSENDDGITVAVEVLLLGNKFWSKFWNLVFNVFQKYSGIAENPLFHA